MQAADAGSGNAFERFFKFKQWDTSVKRDTLAGLATFMVMAYIIFVNPTHPRSRTATPRVSPSPRLSRRRVSWPES